MFGYIRPVKEELKVKEHELYKCSYCGLCHALKHSVGCLAQLSLNYDFVFLALLSSAINNQKIEIVKKRCPVHPFKPIPVVQPNETFELTAKLNAAMAYYKISDDINDVKYPKKIKYLLLKPFVSHIKKKAKLDSVFDIDLRDKLGKLNMLEKEKCSSPDQMADVFGGFMGSMFSYTVLKEDKKQLSTAYGNILGRWIYLIDALDDYSRDKKRGEYNPFIYSGLLPDNLIKQSLVLTIKDIEALLMLTEFNDKSVENIIKNIVFLGMPSIGEQTVEKMRKSLTEKSKGVVVEIND